ncbi:MAG TPA: c(7)-type cytochrome triheme domain-containing protein [Thermodesulfobacteriota bacterium]|nr:c(7)-type cytochrome triheme domain-containing protein [Thermodesulfobacteriota bacterium]
MRIVACAAALCALLLGLSSPVLAVGAARSVIYGGAGQGKVIFDGRTHFSKGLVCNDCHLTTFAMGRKALITMDDHNGGGACFVCHDGKKAFNDCASCHRKF